MNIKEQIGGISAFDIKKKLHLVQNGSAYCLYSLDLKLINCVELEANIQTVREAEYGCMLNDVNGNGYLIKDFELDKVDYYLLHANSYYLYGIKDVLYKLNVDNKDVLWNSVYHSLICYFKNNVLFTRTRHRKSADLINCIDGEDGRCLWRFNLSELGEDFSSPYQVKKFIHLDGGLIWLALNHHTVIALDVVSGMLKMKLSSISDFNCDWLPPLIPAPEAMLMDETRNCLVGFMWEFYWEINPKSGDISFFDLSEYFKAEEIRNDKSEYVLGEKHIYFISRHKSKLGALNLETRKLDWVHAFDCENGVGVEILEIKGNDMMLGVLDRDHTLHLFDGF